MNDRPLTGETPGNARTGTSPGVVAHRRLTVVFIGMGGTAAVIPALLPALAARYEGEIEGVLPAVPALFTGLVIGIVAGGWLGRRADRDLLVSIASGVQAAGLIIIAAASGPPALLIGAAISGAGFGLAEVVGTASARRASESGSPKLLTRLMAGLAASAMVTPVVVLIATEWGWPGAAAIVVALVHLALVPYRRAAPGRDTPVEPTVVHDPLTRVAVTVTGRMGGLVLLAAAVFCYVGAETILAGWSAAAVVSTTSAPASIAALGTSAFWLLMVAGRMLGARILTRPGAALPLLVVASVVMFGALLATTAVDDEGGIPVLVAVALAVLAAAPCYGILLGLAVDQVDAERAAPVASVVITVGAVGGAALPAIASFAGVSTSYAVAAAAAAGVAAFTIVFAVGARRTTNKKESGQ